MNEEYVTRAFRGEAIYLPDKDEPLVFKVQMLGHLLVSSGSVSASDPLMIHTINSFSLPVPCGSFPVEVAVAQIGNDTRIAYAKLLFNNEVPIKWEMATLKDQDPSVLSKHEFFGYPVDSGTGCFMDPEAGQMLLLRMKENEDYFDEIMDELQKTTVHTWSWANINPNNASDLNILMFTSGWGDGVYPSYFGFSSSGNVVSLVTDFLVTYDQGDLDAQKAVDFSKQKPNQENKKKWWQLLFRLN